MGQTDTINDKAITFNKPKERIDGPNPTYDQKYQERYKQRRKIICWYSALFIKPLRTGRTFYVQLINIFIIKCFTLGFC